MSTSICIKQWIKENGQEKLNIILENNRRLVHSIAHQYSYKSNKIYGDLVSEGMLGILMAVCKYDPSYNTSFQTYAYYWIKAKVSYSCKKFSKFLPVAENYNFDGNIHDIIEHPDINIMEGIIKKEHTSLFIKAIRNLPPKEQYIIEHRYMKSKKYTLASIGSELKMTKQNVQYLEKRALKKMKLLLKSYL